jgi:Rieske Fe-S protein
VALEPGRRPVRIGRRSFLDYLFGTGLAALAGAIVYPILHFLVPPTVKEVTAAAVAVAKASGLAPNAGRIVPFGGKPALVLRTPQGEVRAFSAVCTHLACTVQYRGDLKHIWCACHDGHYDLHGQVVAGPPPRPLEEFKVTVKDDDVIISRV